MKILFLFMAVMLVASVVEAGQQLVNSKAPQISLQDQYDKPFSLRRLEGSVVVLIASDKEGSAQNDAWKDAILRKYKGRVALLGVADVRGVPFFLKNRIKKDFQKDQGSILLDWDGVVFTSYGLTKKAANVIVIDRKGYIRQVRSGAAEREKVEQLFREIDAAL